MTYTWLSYPLVMNAPRPPAIPSPSLEDFLRIDSDGASVQKLCLYSHTGTHLDTSAHVEPCGAFIESYEPGELTFEMPYVMDIEISDDGLVMPEHFGRHEQGIKAADFLIVRFNLAQFRSYEPSRFSAHSPGFSLEAAEFIARGFPGLKAIGTDAPSIACINSIGETMRAHNIILAMNGGRMLIIEEMKLDVNLKGLKWVGLQPWRVAGMHSGPCNVVGMLE